MVAEKSMVRRSAGMQRRIFVTSTSKSRFRIRSASSITKRELDPMIYRRVDNAAYEVKAMKLHTYKYHYKRPAFTPIYLVTTCTVHSSFKVHTLLIKYENAIGNRNHSLHLKKKMRFSEIKKRSSPLKACRTSNF